MYTAEELRLLEVLDTHYQWPAVYPFKFIVPTAQGPALEAHFTDAQGKELRPSESGKYTGYTFHCAMSSGQEVLEVYRRVRGIQGLVSL